MPAHPTTRRGEPARVALLRIALTALAALICLAAGLVAWYEIGHGGRVYNGVKVLGRDLGGMSRDEAAADITAASAGYPADSVALSGAGGSWSFPASALGVGVDVPRTVDAAMAGRDGNFAR